MAAMFTWCEGRPAQASEGSGFTGLKRVHTNCAYSVATPK